MFLVYTHTSIVRVFFITAASFGALSLWGYTTQRDLSGMGSFLIMGLFGIIIASLVNIFLASSALQWMISVVGVLVFSGLTAWDTQRLKNEYIYGAMEGDVLERSAIMGALSLYLDFLNLFTFLLQLLGRTGRVTARRRQRRRGSDHATAKPRPRPGLLSVEPAAFAAAPARRPLASGAGPRAALDLCPRRRRPTRRGAQPPEGPGHRRSIHVRLRPQLCGDRPRIPRATARLIDAGLRAHMIRVYNYMAVGVALTGVVAWAHLQL